MANKVSLSTRIGGITDVNTLVFDQGNTGQAERNLNALVEIATPMENPINNTDLLTISQNHEDEFKSQINNFSEQFDGIIANADAGYKDLKNALANAIQMVKNAGSDSNVNTGPFSNDATSGGGGGGGGGDDGGNGEIIAPFVPVNPNEPVTEANTSPKTEPDSSPNTEPNTNPNTEPNTNPNTEPNTNPNTSPSTEPSSNPTESGIIGTPLNPSNPFGDTGVGQGTWSKFTPEEQEAIKSKLQAMGYTDDEIDQIMNGSASAPSLVVNELTSALESNYSPELRNELISRYGFDIFNEDGTVDKEKLALALVMDNKEGMDEYSMIELLHSKGIDIVNQTMYDNVAERLSNLITQYPDLRDKLLEKYGFDIFNADGTINRDKLTLALLMDMEDTADDFDLVSYLTETYGEEATKALLGNIAKPVYNKKTSRGTGIVTTAAGVGLLGATAGGLAFLAKKKKDAEDAELKYLEDEELSEGSYPEGEKDEEVSSEEKESDKEWLYGLGLGLAAKREDLSSSDDISIGAAKNNQDTISG